MCDPTFLNDTVTLFLLGVAFAAMGLVGVLFGGVGPRLRPWLMPLLTAAVLAPLGAAAALTDWPRPVWFPLAVLAQVSLFVAALRTVLLHALARRTVQVLTTPRGQGALLVLLGGGLVVAQLCRIDRQTEADLKAGDDHLAALASAPALAPLTSFRAVTDAGRPVALWQAVTTPEDTDLGQVERTFLADQYNRHLLQTMAPQAGFNCHGWIFTGGRCWVRGGDVDAILRDNRYESVSRPAPGDLAVYRDNQGNVAHTALVRVSREDGGVLLESKWGKLGGYIHSAERHAYTGYSCTYYHTRRGGHQLLGSRPGTLLNNGV